MRLSPLALVLGLAACGGSDRSDLFDHGSASSSGGSTPADPTAPASPVGGAPIQGGPGSAPSPSAKIARLQTASATGTGNASVAFDAATQTGSLLVLAIGVNWQADAGAIQVSKDWKRIVTSTDSFFSATSSVLYAFEGAPAQVAHDPVRVSVQSGMDRIFLTLAEYGGVRPGGALDQTARGVDGQSGYTPTTAQPEELWLALFTSRDAMQGPPTDGFAPVSTQSTVDGAMTFAERFSGAVGSAGAKFPVALWESAGVTATFRR
jgi:hypothetical protein